jgi:DNA-binding transcriptional MerR regulator
MIHKTDNAYKSIGEVAEILELINKKKGSLNTHTIRFWEKNFKQIKPKILSGNRRYYDKKAIEVLKKVKFLLKDQGMTISGVKKLLNSNTSFKLDEISKNPISVDNSSIKIKLKKILNLVKEIKKLK